MVPLLYHALCLKSYYDISDVMSGKAGEAEVTGTCHYGKNKIYNEQIK